MKILIAGPQGSGKTTQAELLAQALGLPLFSTGQFLRELAKKGGKVAKQIRKHLESGTLIPDDLVLTLVSNELKKPQFKKGFIIEGNPRTLNQAKKFNISLDLVIELKLSNRACLQRLLKRNRADDTKDLIQKRLAIYRQQTVPMLAYYKKLGILHQVNGEGAIEDIHRQILAVVHKVRHNS